MKIVCIIGMGRSGTSLLAQILSRLGVYFGEPDELIGPTPTNERGHYEYMAINTILESALAANGVSWLTDQPIDADWYRRDTGAYEARWAIRGHLADIMERATRTEARGQSEVVLGFKNPRTALFLPLFRNAFTSLRLDPVYLCCLRDPYAVAASVARVTPRDAATPEVAAVTLRECLGVWANYYALTRTVLDYPVLDVWYEDWFENPAEQLARVCSHIGTNLVYGTMSAALGAIDPKLQHYGVVARRLPYGLVHAQGETK